MAKQLALKFGKPTLATEKRARNASARELDQWTARILTAKTLADVLERPQRRD